MISCEQHVYVEIACMYHYLVKLTLISGDEIEGVALDVKRNKSREECIKISINNSENLVVLDSVSIMEVLVDNPNFDAVTFK